MADLVPDVGNLLNGDEERDAIHVAVAPVVAGENMTPGRHVGFSDFDTRTVKLAGGEIEAIGIVDPFLQGFINAGDRVWLFLYPKTITSLRHQWTHPAFEDTRKSEEWLRAFAEEWSIEYDDMIEGASSGLGITAMGTDIHSWSEIEDGGKEFWEHLERVTGKRYDESHRENTYFSCSC